MLNKQCGLLCPLRGAQRPPWHWSAFHQNDPAAAVRAMNSYVYQIVKYIGAYIAATNGVDAIVLPPASVKIPILFAAASAKNWPGWGWFRSRGQRRRSRICWNYQTKLTGTGIGHSTDEELVIAQDAYKLTLWQHRFAKCKLTWLFV